MLQSRTSRWTTFTALGCLGLLVGAWFLLVAPRRAEAADIDQQTQDTQSTNQALELKISQLKAQFATLAQDKAALQKIYEELPASYDTPTLVRSLDAMATATGVNLKSVNPGMAVYLQTKAGQTATQSSGQPSGQAGGGAGGSVTGSGSSGASAATGTFKVAEIPVAVVIDGPYFSTVAFLQQLQTQMPRAFLVNSLSLAGADSAGSSGAGSVTLTINGKVFALTSSEQAAGANGTAGTSTSGTGAAGSTGSTGSTGGTTGSTASPPANASGPIGADGGASRLGGSTTTAFGGASRSGVTPGSAEEE